jgi:hypothetical protein
VKQVMEAVNTSITSAQFARPAVAAASRGGAGAPVTAGVRAADGAGNSAPGGIDVPFTTLNVTVNSRFDEAILQIRDAQTGEVEQQIPSVEELESLERLQRSDETQNAISQASLRSDEGATQASLNRQQESIRVRPGNSNGSAQVQLNQNSDSSSSTNTSQSADSGVAGQAVAALQAAGSSTASTGGSGAGDQSAQVSVLA